MNAAAAPTTESDDEAWSAVSAHDVRCEELAESYVLFSLAEEIRLSRFAAMRAAEERLADALEIAVATREALDEATNLSCEAARLVAMRKAAR